MPTAEFGYTDQVIYKLGYPNLGNDSYTGVWPATNPPTYRSQTAHQPTNPLQEFDMNVRNTMIIQGNYDYLNKKIMWDPTLSSSIPNSYYRTTKPAFFGTLPWPPIDPANPPGAFTNANVAKIPAGYRYVYGVEAPGATN